MTSSNSEADIGPHLEWNTLHLRLNINSEELYIEGSNGEFDNQPILNFITSQSIRMLVEHFKISSKDNGKDRL